VHDSKQAVAFLRELIDSLRARLGRTPLLGFRTAAERPGSSVRSGKSPIGAGVIIDLGFSALPGEAEAPFEAPPPARVLARPAARFLAKHGFLHGFHLVRHPSRGTGRREEFVDAPATLA
jgi:hypothetical protein